MMKNLSIHRGTLEYLDRLPSSHFGNPRYRAYCAGFSFVTAPDSSLAYALPNYVGKEVEIRLGTHYGKTTLDSIQEVK